MAPVKLFVETFAEDTRLKVKVKSPDIVSGRIRGTQQLVLPKRGVLATWIVVLQLFRARDPVL